LAAGEPLATINGLRSVWLEVAVPEAEASGVRPGQAVEAHLPAFPGDVLAGKVAAILPQANLDSRTLRLRIELDNPDGRLRPGLTAQVRLQRPALQNALLIPGEAVLRTGQRTLVMLAEEQGRFRPVEVRLGQETADRVEVLHGLQEGQQVVASGQFLLDSEASLRGLPVQGAEVASQAAAKPALHEADGRVVELGANEITLSHGPFNSLGMPGMTMRFPLADPALLQGIAAGDSVRVGVRETDAGLVIERLDAREVQP
ncbi:efflux RND transporter periplasmic adaptor subunit, partial [Pseudomonas sp. CrR25]|nr:efflux RND transporter periplasmic adaptor subunit [Pseudomonas sp. CrR25]